ncbi:HAD-like domain-containing protein [Mariannaea sp. PMI_226]|nr:HAD-like domain-containing protein [Mariannaea sp. PMI_226]
MSPAKISPFAKVKLLTFDVFGTVVDWRSSVTEELVLRAHRKASTDLPEELKTRLHALTEEDWGRFSQEWRDSYGVFCRTFDPDKHAWKDVDEHHRDSLNNLLQAWGLGGIFNETEIESLSLVWHRLRPWEDSSEGLKKLGKTYVTSTLSNGNLSLLHDLNDFGELGFQEFISAETFKAYKPNPVVYQGAARKLGVQPEETALVAAHLGDLEAAKACGYRTVYVERPQEEGRKWAKDTENYQQAKDWVDLWVSEDEDGFRALARKLEEVAGDNN